MKNIFIASLMAFSASAYAGPNQLEVIGLKPDISTQAEVERAKDEFGYVIGGYKLRCNPEYIDDRLSQFLCVTGEGAGSQDIATGSNEKTSNTEIHASLVKGFTKKFGAPTEAGNLPLSNGFGAGFSSNIVMWKDKKGNKLTLISVATKIGEGGLVLESAQLLRKKQQEKSAAEQQRKF